MENLDKKTNLEELPNETNKKMQKQSDSYWLMLLLSVGFYIDSALLIYQEKIIWGILFLVICFTLNCIAGLKTKNKTVEVFSLILSVIVTISVVWWMISRMIVMISCMGLVTSLFEHGS